MLSLKVAEDKLLSLFKYLNLTQHLHISFIMSADPFTQITQCFCLTNFLNSLNIKRFVNSIADNLAFMPNWGAQIIC